MRQEHSRALLVSSLVSTSRTISRVTKALVRQMPKWVKLPSQKQADKTKIQFFAKAGFPNVIGCIDGTQIRILAPTENKHEFVNRKNYHSINVQVNAKCITISDNQSIML